MKWAGLTGGIATGKSTAKKLLEGLGIPVIDADQISRKLSEKGAAGYELIVTQFGGDILLPEGDIDRKKLGKIIFSDSALKDRLEGILHPLIRQEVQSQRRLLQQSGTPLCFYDVPLLFEKNLAADFDCTVLVWCDSKTQMDRLLRRDNLLPEEAQLRIRNQESLVEKVKRADFCLDNSGSIKELELQLATLLKKLQS